MNRISLLRSGQRRSPAAGRWVAPLLLIVVLAPGLMAAQPAGAATINVTTTADELNSDGDCSLREAVRAANTDATVDACPAGSGTDTIIVPAGDYVLTPRWARPAKTWPPMATWTSARMSPSLARAGRRRPSTPPGLTG